MYQGKRILALIPARGGSKGIKEKNIVDLCGRPLISYSIEAAKKSKYVDKIIVSTDSEKIASVAQKCGASVPFLRPDYLATDTATTLDVVIHAVEHMNEMEKKYDTLLLLQPTTPLRDEKDIDEAVEMFFQFNERSLVSVSEVDDNPVLIRTIDELGKAVPLLNRSSTCRRQDMPTFYRVNGCIYINNIEEINKSTSLNDNQMAFIMRKEHSVDIDDLKDLCVASYYLEKSIKNDNKR